MLPVAAVQDRKQSFLRMQSVMCLGEYSASCPLEHFVGYFLAAVGRQAVQHNGMRRRTLQQCSVDLIISEHLLPII